MFVNVTNEQFHALQKLMQLEGIKTDTEIRDQLIGQLSAACMDNGGDFDPALARAGVNTELRVVHRNRANLSGASQNLAVFCGGR
jgi:hypothetical protein